jgi:uncharacterized glyoxalase superfamily protein PhnB
VHVSDARRPSIVPYFGYRDAATAIGWLEEAFGFETTMRWLADDGSVQHAELRSDDGVIMLGQLPDAIGPDEPSRIPAAHGVYVVVGDVDAHHERAVAAGAEVVYPPEDTEWGTRRYRVLDPEGYEWSFGSYVPGATPER